MWKINDVKTRGKIAFLQNYWRSMLAALFLHTLTGLTFMINSSDFAFLSPDGKETDVIAAAIATARDEISFFLTGIFGSWVAVYAVFLIIRFVLINPFSVGCSIFFADNTEGDPASFSLIMYGFRRYLKSVAAMFLRDIMVGACTVLFLIPGMLISYSLMMVPYLLRDEPELSVLGTIKRSRQMMKGSIKRVLLMEVSFIGWYAVGFVTAGLFNTFWTYPYIANANAALYHELRKREGISKE